MKQIAFTVALALVASIAHAQNVARVIVSVGDVSAQRGGAGIPLRLGAEVQNGDTLRTGPESYAQLRFSDGAVVALRSETEFRINEFRYNGVVDGLERAFFSLVKGGFRTVTGVIGKRNRTNYSVQTTVSSIGIRGTHFNLVHCDGGCRGSDGAPAPSGTYGGVSDGRIVAIPLNNPTEREFGAGEFFHVANANAPATPLIAPPGFLTDKLEAQSRSRGSQQQAERNSEQQSGGEGADQSGAPKQAARQQQAQSSGISADGRAQQQTQQKLQPVVYTSTELKTSSGEAAVVPSVSATSTAVSPKGALTVFEHSGSFFVLTDDRTAAFAADSQGRLLSLGPTSSGITVSLASGSITDAGAYTATDGSIFRWGAWAGNTSLTTASGTTTGLPVLYGTATNVNLGSGVILPSTGAVTYSYAGGPGPRDAAGNVGSVGSSTATIDFGRQSMQFTMNISFANIAGYGAAVITASGSGVKTNSTNGLDYSGSISGSCTGAGCQGASASGVVQFGTGGTNGYNFGVAGGGLYSATQGGNVVFLNAYQAGSLNNSLQSFSVGWLSSMSSYFAASMEQPIASIGKNSAGFSSYAVNQVAGASGGSLGSGTIAESGADAAAGNMFWGRWTGSGVQVNIGSSIINPPTGVPFVGGDRTDIMPSTGSAVYSYTGGPNPVSLGGTVGSFTGGAFGVNFATRVVTVATPLALSVGPSNFTLSSCVSGCSYSSGTAVIPAMNLSGICTGGGCSVSAPSSASVSGAFTGNQAQGLATSGRVSGGSLDVVFAAGFKR